MARALVAAFLLALLCCVACDDDEVVCPLVVEPAIVVTITDSLTSAPRSEIATAVATDGAYADTLQPYGGDGLGTELSKAGAYGRPGTYDLRVTAPGYLEWTRASVQATSDECGVRTTELEARLVLDPSNNAPNIADLPDTTVALGDTLRLRAMAEDADGDGLRYGLTVFISWNERDPDLFPAAGIDSRTGELWFAARPQDQPGRTLLVTVDDGRQRRDSTQFHVAVPALEGAPEIRILNGSDVVFDSTIVDFSRQVEFYRRLDPGEASNYRSVVEAYRYAYVEVHFPGMTGIIQPVDYVGEERLAPGRYTYRLTLNPAPTSDLNRIRFELIEAR